jgi:hypothetical protein
MFRPGDEVEWVCPSNHIGHRGLVIRVDSGPTEDILYVNGCGQSGVGYFARRFKRAKPLTPFEQAV